MSRRGDLSYNQFNTGHSHSVEILRRFMLVMTPTLCIQQLGRSHRRRRFIDTQLQYPPNGDDGEKANKRNDLG